MGKILSYSVSKMPSEPKRRRAIIFLTVVLGHASIFILFLVSGRTTPPNEKIGAPSVFTLSATNTPAVIPTAVPILPVNTEAPISSAVEAKSGQQGTEGEVEGETCSPLNQVTSQLTNDPSVPLAIGRVARDDRSISEAIVMWNVEWSSASVDGAPLADVRDRVIFVLKSLPPDCLTTPVQGPRLIAISDQGYTTFLTFGSGEWTWQQLIESEETGISVDASLWPWEDLLQERVPPNF